MEGQQILPPLSHPLFPNAAKQNFEIAIMSEIVKRWSN